MNQEEIILSNSGVTVLGFPVGFSPTSRDFALAFEDEKIRSLTPLNGRQLRVCDSKGVFWLLDLASDNVLCFDVVLAKRKRPTDNDPLECFTGKIRIGQYTVQGPFSFETGETVRNLVFPGLSLDLIPDEKRIRAVLVGFEENENKVKRPASQ